MWWFTFFLGIFIPAYWYSYGPAVFLSFCDVALFITYGGMWMNNKLMVSMAAIGIFIPQCIWIIDFIATACDVQFLGLTNYMFNTQYSLGLRCLSLFHCWLPGLLVYLLYRHGYDNRAGIYWTIVAWVLLICCYTWTDPPGPRQDHKAININFVRGISRTHPQTFMPALCWLLMIMAGLPIVIYYPTHLICTCLFKHTFVKSRGRVLTEKTKFH